MTSTRLPLIRFITPMALLWSASIFSTFVHAEPVKLDVNDISFLAPVPKNKAEAEQLIALDARRADNAPIVPKEMFDDIMLAARSIQHKGSTPTIFRMVLPEGSAEQSFSNPHNWKIAGIRVHPSSLGTSDALVAKFGSPRTVRLIVQPVTTQGESATVHDFGMHVVFAFPDDAGFNAVLDDLVAIKKLVSAKTPTNVELSVHPGFRKNVEGFRDSLRSFVTKHLAPERLQIVSFMGVRPPEPWIFFSMAKVNGRLVKKDLAKDLSASFEKDADVQNGQMLIVGGRAVTPSLVPNSESGEGVSTATLFTGVNPTGKLFPTSLNAELNELRNADIPDRIANPNVHHNRNTDCVSCHTESTLRTSLSFPESKFRFTRAEGVSGIDPKMLPGDNTWNVHNFGWFPDVFTGEAVETITQRAANEAAAAADFINKKIFKIDAAGSPQLAGPTPAPLAPAATPKKMKASALTLVLEIKSHDDFVELKKKLEQMQALPREQNPSWQALDHTGLVHFARFVFIGEEKVAVITSFDGSLDQYASAFANEMGATFDLLLKHTKTAPKLPVKDNQEEFLDFVKKNNLGCIEPFYSAYPNLGVQDILTLQQSAAGQELAGATHKDKANPLTLVVDLKSHEDFLALKAKLEAMQAAPPDGNPSRMALDRLGLVHFARFVFIGEEKIAVITSFDGAIERYVSAFANEMGGTFDLLLKHAKDAPPLPVKEHQSEFLDFVEKHDLKCIEPFYSAYPKLSVQDILTLQGNSSAPQPKQL